MRTTRKQTRLKRSKLENLFRHANGVYYARIKVNNKSKERSLHTADYNLAASLLPETLRELRGASEAHQAGRCDPLDEGSRRDVCAQRQFKRHLSETCESPVP